MLTTTISYTIFFANLNYTEDSSINKLRIKLGYMPESLEGLLKCPGSVNKFISLDHTLKSIGQVIKEHFS